MLPCLDSSLTVVGEGLLADYEDVGGVDIWGDKIFATG